MVDIIIEKGKSRIRKAKKIELIKVDMYLNTKIVLQLRLGTAIEKDTRISKYYYGTKKDYLIHTKLLKKYILYDNSIYTFQLTMHIIVDLKLHHNRHLVQIRFIVKELTRV